MNGVEILTSSEVVTAYAFSWSGFWIVAGIIFVMATIIGIINAIDSGDIAPLIAFVVSGALLGVMFGGLYGCIIQTPTEYATEYKVTISDEVSMNDFLDEYEIIGQEGKIYIVREKD